MSFGCEEYRTWLAGPQAAGVDEARAREHARQCPGCAGLAGRYESALAALTAATAGAGVPPFAAVKERMAARVRSDRRRWVVAGAAAVAAAAGLAAWAVRSPVAATGPAIDRVPVVVVPAAGGVDVTLPDGSVPAPGVATPAPAGTRVRTGPVAGVEVREEATGAIRIEEDTDLVVAAWSADEAVLDLRAGRIEASVAHRQPGQRFEVRTEFAVVRVVGTVFVVEHRPGVETRVLGRSGEVSVSTPGGASVARVGPGESTRVGPAAALAMQPGPEPVPAAQPEPGARLAMAPSRVPASRPGSTAAVAPIAPPRAGAPAAPAQAAAAEPSPSIERARALLSEGRDEEAITLLRGLSPQPGPERARVQALLGDALRLARHPDEARQAYERALQDGTDATLSWVLSDLARLESDLGRAQAAAAAWKRYLAVVPAGPHAARALWEVARLDEAEGRLAAANEGWTRILADFPRSQVAPQAFARIGRTFLDTRQWEAAVAHFQSRVADADPAFAEAAMVGLMRARLGQGRDDDVRALASEYVARFPSGSRRDEVRRLSDALRQPSTVNRQPR